MVSASITSPPGHARRLGDIKMNPFGLFLFYFPRSAVRQVAHEVMAEKLPPDTVGDVWDGAKHLQRDLKRSRPKYAFGLNFFLRYMEWDICLYRAAKAQEVPPLQAAELVEEINRRIFLPVNRVSYAVSRFRSSNTITRAQWIVDLMFKVLFTGPFQRRTYRREGVVAFDVTACPLATYFRDQGVPELTRYAACSQDHYMAQIWGLTLVRPKTIADGHELCDFRFQKRS